MMIKKIAWVAVLVVVGGVAIAAMPTFRGASQPQTSANRLTAIPINNTISESNNKIVSIKTTANKINDSAITNIRQDIADLKNQVTGVLDDLNNLSDQVDRIAEETENPAAIDEITDRVIALEKYDEIMRQKLETLQKNIADVQNYQIAPLETTVEKQGKDIKKAQADIRDNTDLINYNTNLLNKEISQLKQKIQKLEKRIDELTGKTEKDDEEYSK